MNSTNFTNSEKPTEEGEAEDEEEEEGRKRKGGRKEEDSAAVNHKTTHRGSENKECVYCRKRLNKSKCTVIFENTPSSTENIKSVVNCAASA